MRNLWRLLPALGLALLLTVPAAAAYSDMPETYALYNEVQKAGEYGLMNGYADGTFGYAKSITRAQFTAVLVRLMGWETVTPETPHYPDVPPSHYWYAAIETAYAHGVRDTQTQNGVSGFYPDWPITRCVMCELMVQAAGLDSVIGQYNVTQPGSQAGAQIEHLTPFTDLPYLTFGTGYISVAYAIGLTNGTSATTFSPFGTATRGQAAAMLVRMYERLYPETESVSAFYAFSSYSQIALTEGMDVVSAGWSRMRWDGETARLATTSADGNDYFVPSGYADAVNQIAANGAKLYLDVFMDTGDGLTGLLSSAGGRTQAVEQIANELAVPYQALGRNPYDGVTIDFEGYPVSQLPDFAAFLTELRAALPADKGLWVCAMPGDLGGYGQETAATVKAVSGIADKVVLMAYNFDQKQVTLTQAPGVVTRGYLRNRPAPLDYVFRILRSAANAAEDPSKLALGLCFQNVAWEIDAEGNQIAATPVYPTHETLSKRLAQSDTVTERRDTVPCAYYTTEEGRRYFVWYEDAESIQVKRQAARLLNLGGVCVWRLGAVPDGISLTGSGV